MQLLPIDYKAIKEMMNWRGWAIICESLDEKIKPIEDLLLLPTLDDIVWEEKEAAIVKYKKMERIHMLNLKNLPQNLLDTQIKK